MVAGTVADRPHRRHVRRTPGARVSKQCGAEKGAVPGQVHPAARSCCGTGRLESSSPGMSQVRAVAPFDGVGAQLPQLAIFQNHVPWSRATSGIPLWTSKFSTRTKPCTLTARHLHSAVRPVVETIDRQPSAYLKTGTAMCSNTAFSLTACSTVSRLQAPLIGTANSTVARRNSLWFVLLQRRRSVWLFRRS